MIIQITIEISEETYNKVASEMYWLTAKYKDVRNYIELICEKHINDKFRPE